MWIKVGVTGSFVWTFLLFLVSHQGMRFVRDFSFDLWEAFRYHSGANDYNPDDSLPLIIGGIVIVWLVSFLFIRKKPTD